MNDIEALQKRVQILTAEATRLTTETERLRGGKCALEAAARWIPTAERLPERGVQVLCYTSDDVLMLMYYSQAHGYAPCWWDAYDDRMLNSANGREVTHWRPLPTPPEVQP